MKSFYIYKITEINSNQLELEKYKFNNFQIKNNEFHLIKMFDKEIYFLLKTNEVFRNGDIKILTFPSKIKEFYVNYLYFFTVNEFDELLMYKKNNYNVFDCSTLLNQKIDKITVSFDSCLVLTKSKELFVFADNYYGQFNTNQFSLDVFTKIELKKEITDNIIDIQIGAFNTVLYLKRNQFYICGRTFVFGDSSEFKKLDINSIDPTLNAIQNYKSKLNFILNNRQLVDLDFILQ